MKSNRKYIKYNLRDSVAISMNSMHRCEVMFEPIYKTERIMENPVREVIYDEVRTPIQEVIAES